MELLQGWVVLESKIMFIFIVVARPTVVCAITMQITTEGLLKYVQYNLMFSTCLHLIVR